MKRIILFSISLMWLILASGGTPGAGAFDGSSDTTPGIEAVMEQSPEMGDFLRGCEAMRYAIEHNDFASLTDAKMILSSLKLAEFSADDYHIVGNGGESLLQPLVLFTPVYAAELTKRGVIELGAFGDGAHLMRGDDYQFKLLHATIAPKAEVTFSSIAFENCDMALFSMSNSDLKFEVTLSDGSTVPMIVRGNNSIWYTNWDLPEEPEEFRFTVTNQSNEPQTFVVALN